MKKNSVLDSTPVAVCIALASAFVLAWLAVPSSAQQGQKKSDVTFSETAQYIDRGAATCVICHGAAEIKVIDQTAHGNADNPHTPAAQKACESCHGPASLHVSRSGAGERKANIIAFGAGGSASGKQVEACLDCHSKTMGKLEGMEWKGSAHGRLGFINCSTCHKVHSVDNPMKDREKQAETCFRCHGKQKTEHPRFEKQGIVFDKLSCWSCHDVHQLIPQQKTSALGHPTLSAGLN